MDLGNGTKKFFADAAGRPVPKPTAAAMVGSPAGLLNPDRYEFYTFDETGDLVKRLMTLDEIQSIIANGETELGEAGLANYYHQNLPPYSAELALAASSTVTDKVIEEAEATDIGELSSAVPGVHDVVVSVQNVLKGELEASKNKIPLPKPVPSPPTPVMMASPNSSSSWGTILSGIMSNSGSVSNVANQSTYLPIGPIPNIAQELSNTSTETPLHVTQRITLTTLQELDNSSEASFSKRPLFPVSSDIADVEQTANSSLSIHSKLPSLHSSATASHISSSPISSSAPSSPLPSSLTPSPSPSSSSSSHLFPSTSSSLFILSSSSPKPSSPVPSLPKVPSILTSLSESSDKPVSPQSFTPSSLVSETLSTPALKPQPSPLNSSYTSMEETITNSSLVTKDPLNVNENKPLNSYSKPAIGDIQVTFTEISAATQKPHGTTYLPSLMSKIPSSASPAAELELAETGATVSETQSPPSSSDRPPSFVPVNNQKVTSSQQGSGTPVSFLSHNQSHTSERTTNKPSTFAASTASSSSSDSIKLPYVNSALLELPSVESSNNTNISAAQEFFHLFTLANNVSSTSEGIQFTKLTQRPYTASEHSTVMKSSPSTPYPATTVVSALTPAATTTKVQTKKPAESFHSTPTSTYITKIITQPPHSNSNSVQTSTVNPLGATKLSSTAINDKIDDVSTTELIRTNVLSTKPITTTAATKLPLSSTTWKNNAENLLINEGSEFVPMRIESPVGVLPLPTTANGDLDVPPELAESVLGVLSQVADVEGTATTIDYGESGLYIFSTSTTTTQHSSTNGVSSTESNNRTSPASTANNSKLQSIVTSPDNNINKNNNSSNNNDNKKTEIKNVAHSASTADILPETTMHAETNQPNGVPEKLFGETTSQPLGSFYLKESTNDDQTTILLSLENSTSIYEQDTIESTTIEVGDEHKKNNSLDLNKIELKKDDKNSEAPSKLTEAMTELEDQKKVNVEKTKDNNTESTSVKLVLSDDDDNNNNNSSSSSSYNIESLKSNFEILEKGPYDEETTVSVTGETDPNFAINVGITTEAADDVATENDMIEQRESTIFSVPELTTEQPSVSIYRNSIKSKANVSSAGKLDVEEPSTETVAEGQYFTATTVIPESIISRDTMQSSTETAKENSETSTITLTKYKKDDAKLEEESVKGKLTLKTNDEPVDKKISTEHVVKKNEADDEMQRVSTESQESTTELELETTEDETQKEELNMSTSATIDVEFVESMETRTDINIIDKTDENKGISETKTVISFVESRETTTDLPFEDKSEEAIGNETTTFEITTEGFTAEITERYETETTTAEDRFASDSKESPSFREDEIKGTTDRPVTDYEVSKETTASLESKIENSFTEISLEKGSEISVKDVNRWEPVVTSSTGSSKIVTESDVTKKTAANTSWTKLPNLSPSQSNDNKVIDRTAVSSTRRPVSITSTTEDATTPIEIWKFSGLNKEKVKDTKIKAKPQEPQRPQTYVTVDLEPAPQENLGLEATSAGLEEDVRRFAELCNELAFRLWASVTAKGLTPSRSLTISPFAVTSLLAMVFLGARGPTSGQMNDILRLDDMVTFNPHQVFKNVTESVVLSRIQGVATAAFVRELYSDKAKGKVLDFYKERAQQFYDGHVEEVNFISIGDLVRRRTNLLMKRQTRGRVPEYLRNSNILLRPPLAVFSANIFQTDCRQASTEGRDGEMYFTVMPAIRQRRLVPVPAVVWFSGFLAGYEPVLDATAASIVSDNSLVSLIMVLPGQQGQQAPGDGLQRLEQRLIENSYRRGAWSRVLRSLQPRPGLELQIPRFSHRSLLNVTSPLQRMGLKDLFNAEHADLRGINGFTNDLHLSDIIQVNTFSTCAEDAIGSRHHVEVYPTSPQRSGREDLDESQKEGSANFDDGDDLGLSSLPLALRPRQARLPDAPRLRFDRPFLYFVRHNPTGLILHMGRFNPRLLH